MKSKIMLLCVAIIATLLVTLPAFAYTIKIDKQIITINGNNVSKNNVATIVSKNGFVYIAKGKEEIYIDSQDKPFTKDLGIFLWEQDSVRVEFDQLLHKQTYHNIYGYKHKNRYYRIRFSSSELVKSDLFNQIYETLEEK